MENNSLGGCSLGYTSDGKPEYKERGADTVVPFKNSNYKFLSYVETQSWNTQKTVSIGFKANCNSCCRGLTNAAYATYAFNITGVGNCYYSAYPKSGSFNVTYNADSVTFTIPDLSFKTGTTVNLIAFTN